MPAIEGDQSKTGEGKFVVTVMLPFVCPQVVVAGIAVALGGVLGTMVAVVVVEQPPPVTVTV